MLTVTVVLSALALAPQEPLKLGVIARVDRGQPELAYGRGATFAVTAINRAGGVDGAPIELVVEPGAERADESILVHDGEEHGFLLEGELEMQIGEEFITLQAGDSYSFDARLPHHGRNRTDKPAVLVWAVSPVVIPKDAEKNSARSDESKNAKRALSARSKRKKVPSGD